MYDLVTIKKMMEDLFDIHDLEDICYDLLVDYDRVVSPNSKKPKAVREIIQYCRQNQRIEEMIEVLEEKRPGVDWRINRDNNQSANHDTVVDVIIEPYKQAYLHKDECLSLKVINNEIDELTECFGNIYCAYDQDGFFKHSKPVIYDTARLAWSSKTPSTAEGFATIQRGTNGILDLARTDSAKDMLVFTLNSGDDYKHINVGELKIVVHIGGKFKGISFKPIIFNGRIKYVGGSSIIFQET